MQTKTETTPKYGKEVAVKTLLVSGNQLCEMIKSHSKRGCLEDGSQIFRITNVNDYGDWVVEICCGEEPFNDNTN